MNKSLLDMLWVLVAACLVFTMQPGFAALESGLTRSKNTINVAIKNLADTGIAIFVFWLFGYALMFGKTYHGILGETGVLPPLNESAWLATFFLFQVVFCNTSATIVSGAVAERMRFSGYMIETVMISGLIYPVFGHWVWNGAFSNEKLGWLGQLGFVDFAGSSVVHSVGGWVSLAAIMIIGPRKGRFPSGEASRKIHGHDIPMSVLGVFLLWLGWFGFNGGSTLAMNEQVPRIIVNTLLAGATGMLTALAIGWRWKGYPDVSFLINGSLAGLVAITASCHAVDALSAVIIGSLGSLAMLLLEFVLESLQIDDAVGAIPVHLGAGIVGTLSVALFGQPELLKTGLSFMGQLRAQGVGVIVCGLWAFLASYLILSLINRIFPLRISPESEKIGMNVAEHRAPTELIDLLETMSQHEKQGNLSLRASVEPFTEVGQIATLYNRVVNTLQEMITKMGEMNRTLQEKSNDLASVNEELETFNYAVAHDLRAPLRAIDGFSQIVVQRSADRLDNQSKNYLERIQQGANRMGQLINDLLSLSQISQSAMVRMSVDLSEISKTIVATIQRNSPERLTHFVIAPDMLVQGDPGLLKIALENLIGNGWKFTRKQLQARIEVGILDQKEEKVYFVRDNGVGFDMAYASKIFAPFQRLHTATEFEGTGVGLATVMRIIHRHGGRLWTEAAVDQGATFYFTL